MTEIKEQITSQHKADLLRVMFHARILKLYITDLIDKNPDTSDSIRNGTFRTIREIEVLEKKIINITDDQFSWLSNEINQSKLWDMSAISDLIARIGLEEKPGFYEEFLGLLIQCLNSILYMQEKRKNINFGKYKLLFKLLIDEIKADTDRIEGQIIYKNGALFIKSTIE